MDLMETQRSEWVSLEKKSLNELAEKQEAKQ